MEKIVKLSLKNIINFCYFNLNKIMDISKEMTTQFKKLTSGLIFNNNF